MRSAKSILILFIFIFGLFFTQTKAQETKKPKQIKILNNYGEIPFEDGKTEIVDIRFFGLDSDYENYEAPIGQPIRERDIFRELKENRSFIKAGEKFHGYKVSKAVKAIRKFVNSSGYPEAEINAYGELLPENKMKLIISVERGTPILVSEIRFEGLEKLTNQELVTNLLGCLVDNWIVYDERRYEYCVQKHTRDYLSGKGFFQAKIRKVLPEKSQSSYIVKIFVNEGVRYRIGEIYIKNAKVFSQNEIIEMLGINVGDVANGTKIREFLFNDLKDKYADKGYIDFDVELNPQYIEPIAEGLDATVNIDITIYEGKQFKVGRINFKGISEEEEQRLRDLFVLKEGEIYSQSKFEEGLKKINSLKEFLPVGVDVGLNFEGSDRSSKVVKWVSKDKPYVYIDITTSKLTDEEREDIYNNQELLKGFN